MILFFAAQTLAGGMCSTCLSIHQSLANWWMVIGLSMVLVLKSVTSTDLELLMLKLWSPEASTGSTCPLSKPTQ